MKFDTIEQYINLVPKCEFCGSTMKTSLSGSITPNYAPKYNMTFATTVFADDLWKQRLEGLAGNGKIDDNFHTMTYNDQETDELVTFSYSLMGASHPIMSIEKKTNRVIGDLDRVQKVIWDHKLTLARHCEGPICHETGNRYLSETFPLVLERVSKRICPILLSLEMLAIKPKERTYGLITPYNNGKINKTLLVAIQKNEIIKQLPIIHLHKIRGGDVITNKIKTLITFS